MIRPRLPFDFSRRAFARMSTMLTLPESTMNSGASCRTSAASTMCVQSSAATRAARILSHGTFDSAHSRRIPISNRDISRENMTTDVPGGRGRPSRRCGRGS